MSNRTHWTPILWKFGEVWPSESIYFYDVFAEHLPILRMLIVAVQFAPLRRLIRLLGNPSKLTVVVGPRLKTCYKHTKLLRIRAFAQILIVPFKLWRHWTDNVCADVLLKLCSCIIVCRPAFGFSP